MKTNPVGNSININIMPSTVTPFMKLIISIQINAIIKLNKNNKLK